MSNLSQFSGGGGGGGETHIKTDPRQLTRSAVDDLRIKFSNTAQTRTDLSSFWDRVGYIPRIASMFVSAADTYATLLNITNAPNGGYIHWIISNAVNSTTNPSSTVRITVDGNDPVEFSYSFVAGVKARMVLGGGIVNANTSVNTADLTKLEYIGNNYYDVGIARSADNAYSIENFDDNINHVYGTSSLVNMIISDFGILSTMPFERLRFESSILIEIKMQVLSTSSFAQNAACFYSLK